MWINEVEPCKGYNATQSSSSRVDKGDILFVYGEGLTEGMNYIDVVVDSTNSTYGGNITVVPATLVKNLGDNCSIPGIIDMDMDSLYMKSVFENNPDLDKYYITNFSIHLSDEIESYFEIGFFPEEDAADGFFCVNTLPMIKESHMIAGIGPQDHGLQPNFTFWWKYDIEYFEFGDKRSVGEAQTIVDNGTSEVLGNFTSIFYPDPVPGNLCDYLNKTGSKFEIKVGEGTTSLSFDDLYLEDEQSCLIVHNSNMPSNLVVSGLPFYNKYLPYQT